MTLSFKALGPRDSGTFEEYVVKLLERAASQQLRPSEVI